MSDLLFSRAEIEGLAEKLDSPQAQLSEREKRLLVAIFAAAGNKVSSISADSGDIIVTDLRSQLLRAFIPDEGEDYILKAHDIDPTGGPEY